MSIDFAALRHEREARRGAPAPVNPVVNPPTNTEDIVPDPMKETQEKHEKPAEPCLNAYDDDSERAEMLKTKEPSLGSTVCLFDEAMAWNGLPRPVVQSHQGYGIVPRSQFLANWSALTQCSFDAFTEKDWENVVVAGGAVLHCLTPGFNPEELPNGDIDLFLHGLTEAQARAKCERLFELIKMTPGCTGPKAVLAMRTPNTLTFVLPAPKRYVQIVSRRYHRMNVSFSHTPRAYVALAPSQSPLPLSVRSSASTQAPMKSSPAST